MNDTSSISKARLEHFADTYVDCFMQLSKDKFAAMLGEKVTATVVRILKDKEPKELQIEGREKIIEVYNTGYFDITSDCKLIKKEFQVTQNEVIIKCKVEETKDGQELNGRYRLKTEIKLQLEEPDNTEEGYLKIVSFCQSTKLKKITS